MKLLLAFALLGAPMAGHAQPRRETKLATSSQCVGFFGGVAYTAAYGSSSADLCNVLIQRCANSIKAAGQYYAIPQRVPPPYYVCQ